MKTVGELKRERGIRSEPQYDSMYTPINRKPKFFKPLKVPKELKAALPYKDKTKDFYTGRSNLKKQRVAVVRNEHETEVLCSLFFFSFVTIYVIRGQSLKEYQHL